MKVTFKPLTEAKTGFAPEILDNNGNKVEVVPVDLQVGETEATLTFKTPLSVDPVGVWTVGGVKFDNDAVKNYNDIVTAALNGNEVALLAALKKAGLSNVKDENITAYLTAINASTTKEKLADIQTIIDKTNETSLTASEAAAAVKAVNDATNQVQLLAALQGKVFTRVNPDWIVDYNLAIVAAKATPTNTDTVAKIQAIVDSVNSTKIEEANEASTTVATQNAVTELIKKYVADDVAPATAKADAIKASEIKAAIFGVKEATTPATVYNALVKLSSLDGTNLPATALNANLKTEYLTAKNAANISGTTDVSQLRTDVVTAADTAALSAINTITITTDLADVKAKLQKLADVTSHLGTSKFDMSTVVDTRLADYRDALANTEVTTQENVETAIASVNNKANVAKNLATLKDTNATVVEVRNALTELAAGVEANTTTTAYLNASSQVKLEVAQFIIDNRDKLADELTVENVTNHEDSTPPAPTYATHAIQKALADHAAKVAEFNTIGNLADATITSTKDALDAYAYDPYVALTTSQKLAVAEEINKLTKSDGGNPPTITPLNFNDEDKVTTLKQANAYIDAAIAVVLGN
ncbi:hypothetical protein [Ureibacillus thermosphaericus]|uniref:Uncharacterized protein n=1 Tax=Ureibacillus thermosphaericus TaxID=51173 RepID=A0A840PWL8_URETH|nr:hypothetical protein [Ureibacillus thermosphaericus]MBB5149102.1 hypothetical protein [Ureibacillus thermosphaericus]NKZ31866.1 hypothetical protein [Ureibacillus thermosphaericus]